MNIFFKLPVNLVSQYIRIFIGISSVVFSAFFLSKLIVAPDPKVIIVGLFCVCALIFAFIKQEYAVYTVLFLMFFHHPFRFFYNSNNVLVLLLAMFLFVRNAVESRSVLSFSVIKNNPFYHVTIVIFASYLVSWLVAWQSGSFGLHFHSKYLMGVFCALLMGNLLIGFVQDYPSRSIIIQKILLLLLVANLLIGLLSWLNPDLGIIRVMIKFATGAERSGVVLIGEGQQFAIRLGGLTFFWEAYAEYLMMAVIVLTGWYVSLKENEKVLKFGVVILLLLSFLELLLTNTRGATVLAAVGVLFVIFVYADLSVRSRVTVLVSVGVVCAIVLGVAVYSGKLTLFERFSSFSEMKKTEFGYLPTGRTMVWLPSLRHLAKEGFLLGAGPSYLPLTSWDGLGGLKWPHNLILLILSTVGTLGLGAYSYLVYKLIKIRKAIAASSDNRKYFFYKFLWIAIILFFVDTMKYDGFLRTTENYFYYIWFVLAFMFSVLNHESVKTQY